MALLVVRFGLDGLEALTLSFLELVHGRVQSCALSCNDVFLRLGEEIAQEVRRHRFFAPPRFGTAGITSPTRSLVGRVGDVRRLFEVDVGVLVDPCLSRCSHMPSAKAVGEKSVAVWATSSRLHKRAPEQDLREPVRLMSSLAHPPRQRRKWRQLRYVRFQALSLSLEPL